MTGTELCRAFNAEGHATAIVRRDETGKVTVHGRTDSALRALREAGYPDTRVATMNSELADALRNSKLSGG